MCKDSVEEVEEVLPVKQGLKLMSAVMAPSDDSVEEVLPVKQGLKHLKQPQFHAVLGLKRYFQ
ncbi:hypothetical protein JCM21531_4025 [Acetivibrio straminisolvens JCM 21531]|uniref:Uncharacterized protein n=1 Tax=Acetivibrio straminisolvens JCM 21531 TaxID=1294263 RepID=W4VCF3_9FIRM|nr:hypothetical protein JCM21531_4025 [Acetivibrio straminisolvens JCM 21531]